MSRLRAFAVNLATVLASIAVTLLLIEIALKFLPVATAPAVAGPTADNPIQRYAANAPFTWSLGWNFRDVVHGRTNAQGFVADYDYDAGAGTPLVAVVGDSYVESLMVPFAETLTGRLQAKLGKQGRAYAIAQSGSPLSQYVAYARHACAVYRPQRLVAVVVGNDFDESVYAHRQRQGIHHLYPRADGGFEFKLTPQPPIGFAERVLRDSALALYLVRNVGALRLLNAPGGAGADGAMEAFVGNTRAAADPARLSEGAKVIAWFLAALPQAACLPPRDIAIVVDAIRPELYDAAALARANSSYFGQMRAALIAAARMAGFLVVDMEPQFRTAYAAERRRFEFRNDGHWNSRGHALAASAVADALADWPPLAGSKSKGQ